jgi:hypothetical protein
MGFAFVQMPKKSLDKALAPIYIVSCLQPLQHSEDAIDKDLFSIMILTKRR